MKKRRTSAAISIWQRIAACILVVLMLVPYGLPNMVYAVDDSSPPTIVSTSQGDGSSSSDADQTPGDGDDQTPGDGDDQTPGDGDDQTPGDGDDQAPGDG